MSRQMVTKFLIFVCVLTASVCSHYDEPFANLALGKTATQISTLEYVSDGVTYSDDPGVNLALGKTAIQISTEEYKSDNVTYPGNASAAVDGNVMAAGPNQTCTSTGKHVGEIWWLVDLGDIYFITEVRILQRRTVKNFTIKASVNWNSTTREMINPVICYQQRKRIPRDEMTSLPCFSPVMGRYIRIAKYRDVSRRLGMCEVEVYGKSTVRYNMLDVRKGKRSESPRIEALQSVSVVTCSALCRSHEDCTSFNMAADGGVCELIADPVGNEDVNEESTSGWTRYVMN